MKSVDARCPRCYARLGQPVPHEVGEIDCDLLFSRLIARRSGWMLDTRARYSEIWQGDLEITSRSSENIAILGPACGFGWALGPWLGLPASAFIALAKGRSSLRMRDAVQEVAARLTKDVEFLHEVEAEIALAVLSGRTDDGKLAAVERRRRPKKSKERTELVLIVGGSS